MHPETDRSGGLHIILFFSLKDWIIHILQVEHDIEAVKRRIHLVAEENDQTQARLQTALAKLEDTQEKADGSERLVPSV